MFGCRTRSSVRHPPPFDRRRCHTRSRACRRSSATTPRPLARVASHVLARARTPRPTRLRSEHTCALTRKSSRLTTRKRREDGVFVLQARGTAPGPRARARARARAHPGAGRVARARARHARARPPAREPQPKKKKKNPPRRSRRRRRCATCSRCSPKWTRPSPARWASPSSRRRSSGSLCSARGSARTSKSRRPPILI